MTGHGIVAFRGVVLWWMSLALSDECTQRDTVIDSINTHPTAPLVNWSASKSPLATRLTHAWPKPMSSNVAISTPTLNEVLLLMVRVPAW